MDLWSVAIDGITSSQTTTSACFLKQKPLPPFLKHQPLPLAWYITQAAGASLSWMAVSSLLILLNKYLMVDLK